MPKVTLNATTPTNQKIATLAGEFLSALHEHHVNLVNNAHTTLMTIVELFRNYREIKAEYAELYSIVDTLADALAEGAEEMEGYVLYHEEVEKLFAAIEKITEPQPIEDEDEDDVPEELPDGTTISA